MFYKLSSVKTTKKATYNSLDCRDRTSTEKPNNFGSNRRHEESLMSGPTGLHLWWPWPYTESLDNASDSKKKKQRDPSCPHLILTSKRREWVYEWELNKGISTKALTWGRAECLPCLTQCYLSTVTLTCSYSWGHLQGLQTAKTQTNWKEGREDFPMPLSDLLVDESLHCGLIFFFSAGVTFGCKPDISRALCALTRMCAWGTVSKRRGTKVLQGTNRLVFFFLGPWVRVQLTNCVMYMWSNHVSRQKCLYLFQRATFEGRGKSWPS